MKALPLAAERRTQTGSGPARRLRAEGRVPGVVYGAGEEATLLSVSWPDLRVVLVEGGQNAIVNLDIEGDETLALLYDVQKDPVRLDVEHIDFLKVREGVEITVTVPLLITGTADAVSKQGAVVEQQLNELVVAAPPRAIPSALELDISEMTLERNLTVQDLELPELVRLVDIADDQILAVGKKTRATLAFEREQAKGEDGDDTGEAGEE